VGRKKECSKALRADYKLTLYKTNNNSKITKFPVTTRQEVGEHWIMLAVNSLVVTGYINRIQNEYRKSRNN
jgi:hypothetical protein